MSPDGHAVADRAARLASEALTRELATYPKPGLVSYRDSGSHSDMAAKTLEAGIRALREWFRRLALAGFRGAPLAELRQLGLEADACMLDATGGVNTHRGALYALGLLAAAAGRRAAGRAGTPDEPLGAIVRRCWGRQLAAPDGGGGPGRGLMPHRLAGARGEAAAGFPHVYRVALPALRRAAARQAQEDAQAHCLFAVAARLADTNVLRRGGPAGLRWARAAAGEFMAHGGVHQPRWRRRAESIHRAFVRRRLSAGGAADLLAVAIFVNAWEELP